MPSESFHWQQQPPPPSNRKHSHQLRVLALLVKIETSIASLQSSLQLTEQNKKLREAMTITN